MWDLFEEIIPVFFRKTFLQKFSKLLESSKNHIMNPYTFPMIILSFLFHFSFTPFFFFNLEYFKTNPRYLVISPVNNWVYFSTWERHLLFSKYNYHAFITCNKIKNNFLILTNTQSIAHGCLFTIDFFAFETRQSPYVAFCCVSSVSNRLFPTFYDIEYFGQHSFLNCPSVSNWFDTSHIIL